MFDGQRMMTARQLYFTLATAFASHTFGHQASWQLGEKRAECRAAASELPAQRAAVQYPEQFDSSNVAPAQQTAAEGSAGGSGFQLGQQTILPMSNSENLGHQPADESQLAAEGRVRLSGVTKSTGYASVCTTHRLGGNTWHSADCGFYLWTDTVFSQLVALVSVCSGAAYLVCIALAVASARGVLVRCGSGRPQDSLSIWGFSATCSNSSTTCF